MRFANPPSFNELVEIGVIRCGPTSLRIYWKQDGRRVILCRGSEVFEQPDMFIRTSLSPFFPGADVGALEVQCAQIYDPDGSPGKGMNHPNELLDCEWSDFACDRLLVQATVSAG